MVLRRATGCWTALPLPLGLPLSPQTCHPVLSLWSLPENPRALGQDPGGLGPPSLLCSFLPDLGKTLKVLRGCPSHPPGHGRSTHAHQGYYTGWIHACSSPSRSCTFCQISCTLSQPGSPPANRLLVDLG